MTLLFVNYRCYHCDPSTNKQETFNLDIKIPKKTKKELDNGIIDEETEWEGYAD